MFGDVSCSNCSVSELVFRQDAFLMITMFNVKKLKQLLAKGEDMIVQYFSSKYFLLTPRLNTYIIKHSQFFL